ncbi:MAG: hypothetical protein RLZZ401_1712, partial [Pseudomonadota bacterium]
MSAPPAAPAHYKFWPKRLPHHLTPPATSLWHNLAISAQRYPYKAALVFFGRSFSYAETLHKAERLAAYLQARGVQKGDRVALCMQNCPQLVIAHFAILRANAVVVPVNPMNRAEELKHYITDPDVKVAITTGDLAGEWVSASNGLEPAQRLAHLVVTQFTDGMGPTDDVPAAWQTWLLGSYPLPVVRDTQTHAWADAVACTGPLSDPDAAPEDLAVLPYTSGTTGLPKGCMHPHRSIMHNAVASCLWATASSEGRSLCVVPMFHITGMVSVMHAAIYSG